MIIRQSAMFCKVSMLSGRWEGQTGSANIQTSNMQHLLCFVCVGLSAARTNHQPLLLLRFMSKCGLNLEERWPRCDADGFDVSD